MSHFKRGRKLTLLLENWKELPNIQQSAWYSPTTLYNNNLYLSSYRVIADYSLCSHKLICIPMPVYIYPYIISKSSDGLIIRWWCCVDRLIALLLQLSQGPFSCDNSLVLLYLINKTCHSNKRIISYDKFLEHPQGLWLPCNYLLYTTVQSSTELSNVNQLLTKFKLESLSSEAYIHCKAKLNVTSRR